MVHSQVQQDMMNMVAVGFKGRSALDDAVKEHPHCIEYGDDNNGKGDHYACRAAVKEHGMLRPCFYEPDAEGGYYKTEQQGSRIPHEDTCRGHVKTQEAEQGARHGETDKCQARFADRGKISSEERESQQTEPSRQS